VNPSSTRGSAGQVPTALIVGAAVAAGLAIATAAWFRLAPPMGPPDAPVVQQRQLLFADLTDGAIRVTDASTGETVELIEGEAGFARGTLRSLARERRRQSMDATTPITLQAHQDGRLALVDAATGERIELASFGPTNAAVFARMLPDPGVSR
jgi:putative photosynthetic complex assembly protein